MSLVIRHPLFSHFIAFLALLHRCLLSPTTTAPCNLVHDRCDLLRSHRVTSACLWLCSHRLETLVSYMPMHRTTIHTLAHIELRHFRILYESTSDDQHSCTALLVNHVIGLLCLRYSHAITSAPVYFSYPSVLYHAVRAAQPRTAAASALLAPI